MHVLKAEGTLSRKNIESWLPQGVTINEWVSRFHVQVQVWFRQAPLRWGVFQTGKFVSQLTEPFCALSEWQAGCLQTVWSSWVGCVLWDKGAEQTCSSGWEELSKRVRFGHPVGTRTVTCFVVVLELWAHGDSFANHSLAYEPRICALFSACDQDRARNKEKANWCFS